MNKNEASNGSRKQWSRCMTQALSFLKVYSAIPSCTGVINWPRHPGFSSPPVWSSASPHPWVGYNVSLQAQHGRQCHLAVSILVAEWREVSERMFGWQ